MQEVKVDVLPGLVVLAFFASAVAGEILVLHNPEFVTVVEPKIRSALKASRFIKKLDQTFNPELSMTISINYLQMLKSLEVDD